MTKIVRFVENIVNKIDLIIMKLTVWQSLLISVIIMSCLVYVTLFILV